MTTHHNAAFINAIREEGTKEEACDKLQEIWNKLCDLHRQSPAGVKIETLEWKELSTGWIAHTSFHAYEVVKTDQGFMATYANRDFAWGAEDAMKAAAQADYERRVLSCLVSHEPAPGDTQPPSPSIGETQEPAGAEPVAWEGYWPGAGSIDSVTRLTRHRSTMEQWKDDGAEITPLYASPPKTVTITDEMRQAIRVLKLTADGYSAKGDGLGEFVQVENPYYRPDNGSDPYIVVDIAALSSEAHNGQ